MAVQYLAETRPSAIEQKTSRSAPNPIRGLFIPAHKEIESIRRAARASKKFCKSVVLRVIAEANENHALKKAKLPQTTVQVLMPFNESFSPFLGGEQEECMSRDVARLLTKNSIPRTLEVTGDKKDCKALAAKEKTKKRAATDLVAKKKVAELMKKKAAGIIKQAVQVGARARVLKRKLRQLNLVLSL